MVRLSEATPDGILDATRSTANSQVRSFAGTPEAALVFSCHARKDMLGTRVNQELQILEDVHASGTNVMGYYAFAEFAPIREDAHSKLHNMTMVTLLIGERDVNPPRRYREKGNGNADDGALLSRQIERERRYRVELEHLKDNNTAILRTVGREIEEARREVQRQKAQLEVLNKSLENEKRRTDELLRNILPDKIAEELKETGTSEPVLFPDAGVLFTDFKGFTGIAREMSAGELVADLDSIFRAFDSIVERHGIEKLKTIGDSYMCASGLPETVDGHLIRLLDAAWDIKAFMENFNRERERRKKRVWPIRIGVHCGPVVAGIIGSRKFAYDIWGDVVNIASRLESNSRPGQINISLEVYEKVRSHFACDYRGKIMTKNRGEIDMYFVIGKRDVIRGIDSTGDTDRVD